MSIVRYLNNRGGELRASSMLKTLYILLVVALLAGCGSQRVARQDTLQDDVGTVGDVISIKSIGVVGAGSSILIDASGKVKYTAFRLTDPPRLLIDMPGVSLEKVDKPIVVENDYITEIATSSYGEGERKIGRIEVGLNDGIEHDIKVGDDSLMVVLRKNIYISGFAEPEELAVDVEEQLDDYSDVGVEVVDVAAVADEATVDLIDEALESEEEPVVVALDVESASDMSEPGDRITGIETSTSGGNLVLSIVENGLPGSYNAFGLDSPARLVIDIWGVKNILSDRSIAVDDTLVKRIRVGDHPDKSRIVIDLSSDTVPPHGIEKVGNALVVSFGVASDAVLAEVPVDDVAAAAISYDDIAPVEIAPETAPEISAVEAYTPPVQVAVAEVVPEPESPAIQVESVDFSKVEGKARLRIVTSESVHCKVSKSSDGTVVAFDLEDAAISSDLSRILDASDLKTTVQTVSSFQASEGPDSVVRVLVKLNEPSLYGLNQVGNAIYVDFPLPTVKKAQVAESKLGPKIEKNGVQGAFNGRKISLDLTDADITNVLRLIAEVSNLNIISGDDVRGKISLRLIDVPWDQAFDIILRTKGLGKVEEGNVVMVAPLQKIKREETERLASRKSKKKLEELDIRLIPVNYAKASELEEHVKNILSDRGSVSTEKRTNTLIVRDVKASILESVQLVQELDLPTPQVLIETRIVEATNSFTRDLGIQWGVDYGTGGNTHTNTFGSTDQFGQWAVDPKQQTGILKSGGASNVEKKSLTATTGASNYAVNLPAANALGGLGFILGKLGTNPLILDLRLTAGETAGLTKVISRPRITTLDNTEAKIEQGESIPFETTSATGTATEFIDANLSLTVTPHITPDGSVLMKIKASRNSIGSFRSASGAPSINKKEASTEVLVRDGETTVIGGIVVSDNADTGKGIPFLKNIPVLGWLFKSKSLSDSQTELLIFITPTILKDTHESE
ncbi:MAG: type IV pilus secretin PilQ [Thermodesulfobacteriota bacterium]